MVVYTLLTFQNSGWIQLLWQKLLGTLLQVYWQYYLTNVGWEVVWFLPEVWFRDFGWMIHFWWFCLQVFEYHQRQKEWRQNTHFLFLHRPEKIIKCYIRKVVCIVQILDLLYDFFYVLSKMKVKINSVIVHWGRP